MIWLTRSYAFGRRKARRTRQKAPKKAAERRVRIGAIRLGQVLDVHLSPAEAYGEVNPEAIFSVEIAQLPGAESVSVGEQVYLQDQYGRPLPVKVAAKDDTTITFDANHEMAGKELNFRIELVEVLD